MCKSSEQLALIGQFGGGRESGYRTTVVERRRIHSNQRTDARLLWRGKKQIGRWTCDWASAQARATKAEMV